MRNTQQEIATPDNFNTSSRKVRSQQPKFGTTKWITYIALFCALAIVMKLVGQVLTITPSFKITPVYVVWLIAAAVLGASGGGIVCFISDLLGAILIPMGPINPLLCIGCTMFGVVAGWCFKLPVKSYAIKFIIAGITSTLLITLLFDSFAIWFWCKFYFGYKSWINKGFWTYIGAERLIQLAVAVINIVMTLAMIPLLERLRLLPKTKNQSNTQRSNETCRTSRSKC